MSNFGAIIVQWKKMTRAGLSTFLLALCLASCGDSKPEGVLSREEYTAVLVDIYLAEAKVSAMVVPPDSAMRMYLAQEPALFKRHGLSDSVVSRTYKYYLSRPKEMEDIFAAVIDSLNLREQKANMYRP